MTCRRLEDRTALVTGSTHGIGLAIARRFAREGSAVVVNDEGAHDGHAVADDLPGETTYVEADVSDPAAVESLVDAAADAYGGIDLLVNNVGAARTGYITDVGLDDWAYTVQTSLRSAWLTAKHGIDHLPAGGSVVNVSSMLSGRTTPASFPEDVAKGALDSLTRSLAVQLGPIGVRVNAVRPGAIYLDDPDDADLEQDPPVDPLGRWGRPEDVAPVVAFLASDDARYVTGVSVPVDAGRSAVLSGGQQVSQAPTRSDLTGDPE